MADDSLGASLVASYLLILALAMYYTIIGASFQLHTTGILTDANVFISSGKDGSSYYRSETFSYNITNGHETSCTLVRPWYYMYYGSAENAAKETIRGTYRELWIASYNTHTCSDKSLKDFNQTIGITLFCVVGFIPAMILLALFYDQIKRCCNRVKSNVSRATDWNNIL